MTMLLRKMWKTHSKHKKLSEEWALAECEGEGWWREARDSGPGEVDVRYAGASPVERAASAPATALAVRSALHSAKLINKKLQRVNLDISAKGIVVSDAESQENVISVSIYRISYCSADAANARVFAVVEGKPMGGSAENHVVHVFVCTRRKHARALALSLAHAFNDAYQAWQANLNQGSSLGSDNKRLAPWVRFQEESDEEELDDWQSPAPLPINGRVRQSESLGERITSSPQRPQIKIGNDKAVSFYSHTGFSTLCLPPRVDNPVRDIFTSACTWAYNCGK